jgi:hypothetical protein
MPVDPKNFFRLYVLLPYASWCEDELCEWKVIATAGGINALVEHAFRAINSPDLIGAPAYQQKLGNYRKNMECVVEHRHIQYVVETYKHVELRDATKIPSSFDTIQKQQAGAFSAAFNRKFDVVRPQLGFLYDDGSGGMPSWIPLRRTVEKCIAYWKNHFDINGSSLMPDNYVHPD